MAKKPRRRLWRWVLGVAAFGILFVFGTNRAVLASADDRIYTQPGKVPKHRVALVLGTSPKVEGGRRNLFFERRMDAAAALYAADRVEKVLVSGDNGTHSYDEPTAMKEALIRRGIPSQAIGLDYAGFRTLDSVIRAHRVFGLQECVIVTDDFHLPRALYIAQEEGIEAVGFQSKPLPRSISPMTYLRETAARSLVWVDVKVLRRQPKFLGAREEI